MLDRHLVRSFLEKVDWATSHAICYLLNGHVERNSAIITRIDILKMVNSKRCEKLKRLPCPYGAVYAKPHTTKNRVGSSMFDHDDKLRQCLAKYLRVNGTHHLAYLDLHKPADANIGNIHFEMDNGNMTPRQLREKIVKYYLKPGEYQVIFFMASPYKDHWRAMERIVADEQRRLDILFNLTKELLPHKPNRVRGASYHQFLKDGKLYNFKG